MSFPFFSTQNPNNKDAATSSDSQFKSLLSWVNTVEYPNCLLASGIKDFHNGIIVCEIVNEIILKNKKPDFLPKIKNVNPNRSEILSNFNMALQTIRSQKGAILPQEIENITGNDLLQDDSKIVTILDYLHSISKLAPEPNSNTNEVSSSDPQFHFGRSSSCQRQPTAEFGSKIEDSTQLKMSDPDSSPKNATTKPPINPNSLYPKLLKGLSSLSQAMRQSPSPIEPSSPNRIEFQSTRDTPTKDERPYKTNSHQNSPVNSNAKKKIPSRPSSLRSSPKHEPRLSLSKISPHSELNSSGTSLNTFFRKSASLGSGAPQTKKTTSGDLKVKNVKRLPEKHTIKTAREYPPELLQQGSGLLNRKSPKSPKLVLDMKRQEKGAGLVSPKILSHSNKMSKSNLRAQISQKLREKDLKGDMPSYASITGRSNSIIDNFKSLSKENKGLTERGSSTRRSSMKNEEINQLTIDPVSEEIKVKLLKWLISINLLKEDIPDLDKKLPKICKNGLIFADILNKIEGRNDVIKGINRENDSKANINSNFIKIMNFLKKSEKINPRYLNAQEHIIEGNEAVFWGFLDDIYCFYHHKISPFDSRYKTTHKISTPDSKSISPKNKKNTDKRPKSAVNSPLQRLKDRIYDDIVNLSNNLKKSGKSPKEKNFMSNQVPIIKMAESNFASNYSSIRGNLEKNSAFYSNRNSEFAGKENDPMKHRESYSSLHSKRASVCFSGRSSPSNFESARRSYLGQTDMSKLFDSKREVHKETRTRSKSRSQVEEDQNIITIEIENQILEWLEQQGFSTFMIKHANSLFEDPLRNGILLCEVIEKFENEHISSIYKQPKSIDECRYNIYTVFNFFVKKETPIPSFLKGKEEAILKGNRNIIFTLLHHLKKIYAAKEQSGKPSPLMPEVSFEISTYVPPYTSKQIESLEYSLLNWLRGLGLLDTQVPKIRSFENLIHHIRDGLLLCELTSLVLQKKISPIHARPITELQSTNNIKKALEGLRNAKDVGQRYLWKDKEIYHQDKFIILGLLEDIHRHFDGLKPRTDPNYFNEGPYITSLPEVKKVAPSEEQKAGIFLSNGNYEKYLANLKSKDIRSATCPRTRGSESNRFLVDAADSKIINDSHGQSPLKDDFSEKYLQNKDSDASDLTFSSPLVIEPIAKNDISDLCEKRLNVEPQKKHSLFERKDKFFK